MMNVWFLKWGVKYSSTQVNQLYHSLKQYLPDYKYTCLTENPEGLDMGTEQLPKHLKRVWGKLYLFEIAKEGDNLFFDIDNEVKYDPKSFINYPFNKLTLMDTSPWKGDLFFRKHAFDVTICSQIMGWSGDHSRIYHHFMTRWQYFQSKYRKGMDRFLVHEKFDYDLFPHGLTASKKHQPEKNAPIVTYEELEF